jgi:hypothetical protein
VLARLASLISAALGVAVTAYVLYGPTATRCSFGTIGSSGVGQPVVTLEPARCETLSLVASQPIWPMPALALAFWAAVPLLGVIGAWRRTPALVLAALLLEMTAIISFAVGPYYLLMVAPALAVTWILTGIARRSAPAPASEASRDY